MSDISDLFTPPILQLPGLRFAGLVKLPSGATAIRFTNIGAGEVREVLLYLVTAGTIEYAYTITDHNLTTTRYYRGSHGNPTDDEMIDVVSWPNL